MLLVPEKLKFRISTTDLEAVYTESNGVQLKIDAQTLVDFKNDHYREVSFHFINVAEVKCTSLNFFELNADKFKLTLKVENAIDFWEKNGVHPDPGVYFVSDSETLREKEKLYDPNNRLNLKHYLVVGYDSYVEIISTSYEVSCN